MKRYQGLLTLLAITWLGCAGVQDQKKKDITKTADYSYKMAQGYFDARQIPMAMRSLMVTLKRDEKHERAHYLLGYIYMGRRDYPKAVRHFKSALDSKPEFHDARNALGATYLAMARWRDAADVFEVLLEEPLYASPELVHNNLGWAHYNLKKYTRAVEHFKMAIFLQPKMCLGHNNLGLSYSKMRKTDVAIKHYRMAIELCPANYAEPHFNLGMLLQGSNDMQARLHFERCSELQPASNLGDRCRQYLAAF